MEWTFAELGGLYLRRNYTLCKKRYTFAHVSKLSSLHFVLPATHAVRTLQTFSA